MSERGSFVTEYLWPCCADSLWTVLNLGGKYLCSVRVPNWMEGAEDKPLPIIAGKVGGLYSGEELDAFEDLREEIEGAICQPITIAVMPDNGDYRFVEFSPKAKHGV